MAFAKTLVTWNPANLNAAIARAFPSSVQTTKLDAIAHSPSPSKGGVRYKLQSATVASLIPTGLGFVFEQGATPHTIAPGASNVERTSFSRTRGAVTRTRTKRGGKPFLFLKGPNVFVSGSVEHPGSRAQPYVGPAAQRWAQYGYRAAARRSLMASGFGARR